MTLIIQTFGSKLITSSSNYFMVVVYEVRPLRSEYTRFGNMAIIKR